MKKLSYYNYEIIYSTSTITIKIFKYIIINYHVIIIYNIMLLLINNTHATFNECGISINY